MSEPAKQNASLDDLKSLVFSSDVHILIMDDDRSVGRMHQLMIERMGFLKVSLVHSIEELLMHLQLSLQEKAVDLILMDIKMPGMDGIEISKTLQNHDVFKAVPIIMLTASTDIQDFINAYKNGAFDFLKKPVQPVELVAKISNAIRVKREQDSFQLKLADFARKLNENEQATLWDSLTGLMNRLGFEKQLERSWKGALKKDETIGLMMIEINDFDKFSQAYGQEAADNCVKQVSWILNEETKAYVFAIYDKSTFVVLLQQPSVELLKNLSATCIQKILDLQIPHRESTLKEFVTISTGAVLTHPLEFSLPRHLVSFADQGLFFAKVNRKFQGSIIEVSNGQLKPYDD